MSENVPPQVPGPGAAGVDEITAVPQTVSVRDAIRRKAGDAAGLICRCRPPDRRTLEALSLQVLGDLGLPREYLGFAMVALGTAFWREPFAATDYRRRLLLLPHCLHKVDRCRGTYGPDGLACARCGACPIGRLQAEAESLGYTVLVAEGTPAVVRTLASTPIEAVFGVACLDSLDKCFDSVTRLGLPYVGVPLLKNGCVETEVEEDLLRLLMVSRSAEPVARPTGYAALLAETAALFQQGELRRVLGAYLKRPKPQADGVGDDPVARAEAIALDWVSRAGKRFRPFITLASYSAVRRSGAPAGVAGDVPVELPDEVKAVAVAMEMFHKASLVHDDVEDDDASRYGMPTVHARYGTPTAVNTGDYLLGLGYRLVVGQAGALGAECAADILAVLSEAHVKLSRGQGAELLLVSGEVHDGRPEDILAIYALKTAPAFYAALAAGMRMAGSSEPHTAQVAAFCRHMGVAYQIVDDLSDLRVGERGDQPVGQDVLSGRPTVLRAFAVEAGVAEALAATLRESSQLGSAATVERVRTLYESCGAIEKARGLVDRCHRRAAEIVRGIEPAPLRDLLAFVLDMVVDARRPDASG